MVVETSSDSAQADVDLLESPGTGDDRRTQTDRAANRAESPPRQRARGAGEHVSAPRDAHAAPTWRRRAVRPALYLLPLLALVVAGYAYVTGGKVMSTDNAYVDVERVGVSTDVAGIVKEVDVTENQHVAMGQVLYRLDPLQFQIALDQAKANLAQTALLLESMKQEYTRLVRDAAAQQAQLDLDQANFERSAALAPSGAVSTSTYDQARYALLAGRNKFEALKQQAQVQLAKLGGNPNTPTRQLPEYLQAQAQVEEAQRQLDHTVVRSPFAGTVTKVSALTPGKYLSASSVAFYVVDTERVWVDATPKETELTHIRPGQAVTVTVDTYPKKQWRGTVESISPAAAQAFSLLPAQNTSGNWVKVVQRIPMRIHVDTSDATLPPLRAGMSAVVDVDTGHARGLPDFLSALL